LPLARITVKERISEIATLLTTKPSLLLSNVLENESSRFLIIITFLAVLEMWKYERIAVKQETLLGPILLERGTRWGETPAAQEEEEMAEFDTPPQNLTATDSRFIL